MNELKNVLSYFPQEIKNIIENYEDIQEIRLRINKPIFLTSNTKFIKLSKVITKDEINTVFENICDKSVYAHQDEINFGFVTIKGGSRVGVAGTAVVSNEKIVSIKNITSLNFRIAKEYKGCSENVLKNCYGNIIIAGPPNSGKTTLLRDIARSLSKFKKVCVVDERFEISGVNQEFDVGEMTDCLKGYDKAYGISLAIRTLSPNVIIFDEIGSLHECEKVFDSLNSGVDIITSVHCDNLEQFMLRLVCKKLIDSCYFNFVVFLSQTPGEIKNIYKIEGNNLCECQVF